jgi:hypothetical protein
MLYEDYNNKPLIHESMKMGEGWRVFNIRNKNNITHIKEEQDDEQQHKKIINNMKMIKRRQ